MGVSVQVLLQCALVGTMTFLFFADVTDGSPLPDSADDTSLHQSLEEALAAMSEDPADEPTDEKRAQQMMCMKKIKVGGRVRFVPYVCWSQRGTKARVKRAYQQLCVKKVNYRGKVVYRPYICWAGRGSELKRLSG